MNSIEQEKLPVMISVRGEQYFDDVDPNATELMTEGTLEQTEDGFLLSYQETELTGMEGTLTTFRIAPDRITLLREGTINSEMIFEEGQKHFSLYETPFGGLMLGVNTHRAKARIGEGGGSLSIRYALEADSQLIGENAFEIQVTEPTLDQRAPLDQAL